MTSAAALAADAARLLSYALRPKAALGGPESEYFNLWREYRSSDEFRDVVDAVVDGLGLVVLDVTNQGLIVAPAEGSPFQFRLVDLQRGLAPERRLLLGLAHLGIAAATYPREADLEGDIVVRRTATQVENLLRAAVESFAEAAPEDPSEDDVVLAWRQFRSTPAVRRKERGSGFKADCTMGIITAAFDWLVDQGMARRAADGQWQMLDRYRVHVRELAGHAALEQLRRLAAVGLTDDEPAEQPQDHHSSAATTTSEDVSSSSAAEDDAAAVADGEEN